MTPPRSYTPAEILAASRGAGPTVIRAGLRILEVLLELERAAPPAPPKASPP